MRYTFPGTTAPPTLVRSDSAVAICGECGTRLPLGAGEPYFWHDCETGQTGAFSPNEVKRLWAQYHRPSLLTRIRRRLSR